MSRTPPPTFPAELAARLPHGARIVSRPTAEGGSMWALSLRLRGGKTVILAIRAEIQDPREVLAEACSLLPAVDPSTRETVEIEVAPGETVEIDRETWESLSRTEQDAWICRRFANRSQLEIRELMSTEETEAARRTSYGREARDVIRLFAERGEVLSWEHAKRWVETFGAPEAGSGVVWWPKGRASVEARDWILAGWTRPDVVASVLIPLAGSTSIATHALDLMGWTPGDFEAGDKDLLLLASAIAEAKAIAAGDEHAAAKARDERAAREEELEHGPPRRRVLRSGTTR